MLVSIGVPTVAPKAVIPAWSKASGTRSSCCAAQTTTGSVPRAASVGAGGVAMVCMTRSASAPDASIRRAASRALSSESTVALTTTSAPSAAAARSASASRSERRSWGTDCSQKSQ